MSKKPAKGAPPKGAPSVVIMIGGGPPPGAPPPGKNGGSPIPPPKAKAPPPNPIQAQKQGIRNSINQAIKQSGKPPLRGKP